MNFYLSEERFKLLVRQTLLLLRLLLSSYQYLDKENGDFVNILEQLEVYNNQILTMLAKHEKEDNKRILPVNDSESIANLMKDFKYDPNKTNEILSKYERLRKEDEDIEKLSLK